MARTSRVKPRNIARKAEIKTTAIKPRSSHGGISFGPRPFGSRLYFAACAPRALEKSSNRLAFLLIAATKQGPNHVRCLSNRVRTSLPREYPYRRDFSRVLSLSCSMGLFQPLSRQRAPKYG